MLTGKQKKFLRAQAHHLKSILQVGKAGIGENFIKQVSLALEANELVKVSVLQNCEQDRFEVADSLVEATGADLVQVLGKTIVLYRPSTNNRQIIFP